VGPILLCGLLLLGAGSESGAAAGESPADAILGVWATENDEAHVEIYRRDGGYHGKFVWFKNDPRDGGLDVKNPEPELRKRKLLGSDFVLDFRFDGKKWKKGRIYNPEDGKRYKADLELKDGVLRVRGWIGIRILGRTVSWTRVH
jgi:uncharacterized protein (DUF2147 family)